VAREGHFFDLKEVESKHDDSVVLRFTRDESREKFIIDIEGAHCGTRIANLIRSAMAEYTHNFPPRYLPKYVVEPESRLAALSDGGAAAPASGARGGGVVPTYKAFCNYYDLPQSAELIAWIDALVDRRCTDMNLNLFAANFRLKPLASALKHNNYFTSFTLSDAPRETAVSAAAVTFIKNSTIKRLTVRNVDAKADGFEALGRVLKGNTAIALTHIDLSRAVMTDRGATGLAHGLGAYRGPLQELRLSHMALTPVGVDALLAAVLAHADGWLASLRVLDLSGNPLGKAAAKLAEVLRVRDGKKAGAVPLSLLLADSGVSVEPLCAALQGSSVRVLDLSGVSLAAALCMKALVAYLAHAAWLRRLVLQRTSLVGAGMRELVGAVANAADTSAVVVDVGNNLAISNADLQHLIKLVAASNGRVVGLGLADLPLEEADYATLFAALQNGDLPLAELALSLATPDAAAAAAAAASSGAAPPKTPRAQQQAAGDALVAKLGKPGAAAPAPPHAEARAKALAAACVCALRLRRLSLVGGVPLGAALNTFLELLPSLKHIVELDVSGHIGGDRALELLGAAAAHSSPLRSIAADANNASVAGFAKFRASESKSLTAFPFPRRDVAALLQLAAAPKSTLKAQSVVDAIDAIDQLCAKNAAAAPLQPTDEEETAELARIAALKAAATRQEDADDKTLKKDKSSKKSKKKDKKKDAADDDE
jgi:hypothetical protein